MAEIEDYQVVTLQLDSQLAYFFACALAGAIESGECSYSLCNANIRRLREIMSVEYNEELDKVISKIKDIGGEQMARVGETAAKHVIEMTKHV